LKGKTLRFYHIRHLRAFKWGYGKVLGEEWRWKLRLEGESRILKIERCILNFEKAKG